MSLRYHACVTMMQLQFYLGWIFSQLEDRSRCNRMKHYCYQLFILCMLYNHCQWHAVFTLLSAAVAPRITLAEGHRDGPGCPLLGT